MTRSLISFLILCPVLAQAATEWTLGTSDHFEIYTTGGPGKAREALNYFERIHAFYTDALHVNPNTQVPTRIILFSNVKEYTPFRPNEGAFAFYQPGPDRDYIVMQSLIDQAYPVVIHEYMHLIVKHLNASTLPLWLNEGWADFYSTMEPRAGRMGVGNIPPGRAYVASGMKQMPLEALFAVGHSSAEYNDAKLIGNFYAQSWALVHMLLASEDYYLQSPKFLELMLKGADSAKAITEAYGKPLSQVAKDLDAYLRVGQFKLRLFPYQSPKPRKDLETRPATAFEANLVTANLQAAGIKGEAEARAAFAQLESENAAHLELQESIAYFEYRHGKREAALPHFAKAAELGSKNWQLYRDYAYLVDAPAKRTALLGQALGLNPDDIDLKLRYADGLLRAGIKAQALATLLSVSSVDKEHAFRYFQLSANANLANDRMEDAKKSAQRAVEFASTPVEKDYAARLLASLSRPELKASFTPVDLPLGADPGVIDAGGTGAPPRLARRDSNGRLPGELQDDQVRLASAAAEVNHSEVVVEAKFDKLDCTGPQPVMQFTLPGAGAASSLRLSMNNPNSILLKGAGAATVNLNCGDQHSQPVRVGYNPLADPAMKTNGDVRYLEMK